MSSSTSKLFFNENHLVQFPYFVLVPLYAYVYVYLCMYLYIYTYIAHICIYICRYVAVTSIKAITSKMGSRCRSILALTQSPSLSFGFQKRQDVSLSYRPFNVTDNLSVLFVQEFHFDLSALTLGTRSAEHLNDARTHYGCFHDSSCLKKIVAFL